MGKKRQLRRRTQTPIVIMIGSGIHREILGSGWPCSPLASWQRLLEDTAEKAGLPARLIGRESLTGDWERLVLGACRHGYRDSLGRPVEEGSKRASRVDQALRAVCKAVLTKESKSLRSKYRGCAVVERLRGLCASRAVTIVDFNFDMLIATALGVKGSPADPPQGAARGFPGKMGELAPLFRMWTVKGTHGLRLWKPHGWIG